MLYPLLLASDDLGNNVTHYAAMCNCQEILDCIEEDQYLKFLSLTNLMGDNIATLLQAGCYNPYCGLLSIRYLHELFYEPREGTKHRPFCGKFKLDEHFEFYCQSDCDGASLRSKRCAGKGLKVIATRNPMR